MGSEEREMTGLTFEWVYTAEADDEKETPCSTVDVCVDQYGEAWVGMTHYRSPKDFEFRPREQYGTNLDTAKEAANIWANGIAADARWTR